MTMQLKFHKHSSIKETLAKSIIKIVILCLILIGVIFLLDKVDFPSPENQIKKDITNEIIKIK